MIRVAIVDDHQLSREGLRAILTAEPDIEIVGMLPDGAGSGQLAATNSVDVMLMDIAMPGVDGIEATRDVRDQSPETEVIILTTLPDDDNVRAALRAGARGYLLKTSSASELISAIRDAHAGRRVFAPDVLDRLADRFSSAAEPGQSSGEGIAADEVPSVLAALTEREREVFREVGRGHSNAEIAKTLFLSEKTVKTYVTRILGKLGLASRVQAVVLAFEIGFVTTTAE
ncbi:MAG: response regulator [Gulosibacter sp.]|uniref:response regulator n=1 Tax=Gulosibacter sp. TaxID=2817531 RepID=UPI003F90AED8